MLGADRSILSVAANAAEDGCSLLHGRIVVID
jgi:hypothetical protein